MSATGRDKLILHNGKFSTMGPDRPEAQNITVANGVVAAVDGWDGSARDPNTQVIDLHGRRVIAGLNDSHTHVIRGGLTYNLELRWDGIPSVADALRILGEQVRRTPPGQWVRVVGGWTEFQFAERRMPTLDEINAVAPETPVFVLHLYCRAMLNKAALLACGYTRDSVDPPGGEIQRDAAGNPTGLLVARPNAGILYGTLGKAPKLSPEHQTNSTRQFMRELNRLGITSIVDAGGGSQVYPDDYVVIDELNKRGEMTIRIAYNIFTQKPKAEKDDFLRCMGLTSPGAGDDFYRCNGAGEMLVWSAADFEDFLEPRPDLAASMQQELIDVVSLLAAHKWPFRIHATYDESIARMLDVFEAVDREIPLDGTRWWFDHCETISDRSLDRVRALGGGIAVQDRMAFQGEYFLARYGAEAANRTPPIRRMLDLGIPVGAGTDATRVSSYNPWLALYWLVSGRTIAGTALRSDANRLDRQEALELYTVGSSWFSGDSGRKGALAVGQFADLAVLSDDYFAVAEEAIKDIESVLTVVDGRVVHAAAEFASLQPSALPVLPEWSPVAVYGGYGAPLDVRNAAGAGVPVLPRRPASAARGAAVGASHFAEFWGMGCDCSSL